MRTIILEYLEARFRARHKADYDPKQIRAVLEGDEVTPDALERALTAIDALFREERPPAGATRHLVDPWLVNGFVVLLCAILGGCAADLPTAPTSSSTAVTVAPPTQPPTPSGPAFSLALLGESPAYTDHWWLTINVVPNREVVSPAVPARVVVDCGTSSPMTLPGFTGTSGATCVFGQPGDYTVRVSAIASDGFTATSTLRVSATARPGPPPPQPLPMYLSLNAQQLNSNPTSSEWGFFANTSGRVVSWDFGDGNGSSRSTPNESHLYRTAGQYTVTVRATPPGGGADVSATQTITVVLCAMVDCP